MLSAGWALRPSRDDLGSNLGISPPWLAITNTSSIEN